MRAAHISRVLREAGERPLPSGTPRSREGLRVSQSLLGHVHVSVDLDNASRARRRLDAIAELLTEQGYTIQRSTDYPSLYVKDTPR